MNKLLTGTAIILALAVAAACAPAGLETAQAAQTVQPRPRVFAPNCAIRPRCPVNVCARTGRCLLGNHSVITGCLIYFCQRR
ncbi:MAG: hypothetical protein ACLP7P_04970 [Rhodomicrobium sp.]